MAKDPQAIIHEFDKELEKAFDAFVKRTEREALAYIKRQARALHNRIIALTPVDTGRARASWNMSVDQPDTTVHEPPEEGWSAAAATAQAKKTQKSALSAFQSASQKIYISNGTPYIEIIESGSYESAPAGMRELAVSQMASGASHIGRVSGGGDE